MSNRIAILGTGLMGAPIVRRLLGAHYDMTVWNRTAAKVEPLLAVGVKAASTPAAAVRGASLIFLCLSDSEAVSEALLGSCGAAQGSSDTRLCLDLSTIGPVATRAFAGRVADERNTGWVDAPVTAGVIGAEDTSLIVICGSDENQVVVAGSPLGHFCNVVRYLGQSVMDRRLSSEISSFFSPICWRSGEMLAFVEIHWLSPQMLRDALSNGRAGSKPLQIVARRMEEQLEDPSILKVRTFAKDVSLVVASPGEMDSLPLCKSIEGLYAGAIGHGFATGISQLCVSHLG